MVELTTIEGGGGRTSGIYALAGEFLELPPPEVNADGNLVEPDTRLVDGFRYHSTSDETLQFGDRVAITIRGDFILDECCRAVDGNHLGGGVPLLDRDDAPAPVDRPPATAVPPAQVGQRQRGRRLRLVDLRGRKEAPLDERQR